MPLPQALGEGAVALPSPIKDPTMLLLLAYLYVRQRMVLKVTT